MASLARQAFLIGLSAFRESVDEPRVMGADAVGDFLRRGLAVASFNLLETFISDRITELALHVNGGVTQFLDLPEKLQRRAIVNPVAVARSEMAWAGGALPDLRDYSADLGASLTAVRTNLRLSPATWKWSGSNMSPDDLHTALRYFHVDQPWESIRAVASRIGFVVTDFAGAPISQQADLAFLAQQRHRSAHDATNPVTTLWLRSVPDQLLRYAIAFDALASCAAQLFRNGHPQMLHDRNFVGSKQLSIRFIQERGGDVAELLEGRTRALRRASDPAVLFSEAEPRCSANQLLVSRAVTNEIGNWSFPAVG